MDLVSGSMFTDLSLEFLISLDLLAIHCKDDIPFSQTGQENSTVCFWQSHQYAALIGRRDWLKGVDVGVPTEAYSQTA